jgi:NAD(P)-dependent dehydrogenase (short-subunit alcohol dehydrogenase family)
MQVRNKSVLITGANRGIGRALVQEALARGATRVYAGTRGALAIIDERVTPVVLDVTKAVQIERAAEIIDRLDILVNNAGVAIHDDLSDADAIEQHLRVNVIGSLNMVHAFLPLLNRSRGAIVNILSLVAVAPLPIIPSYSISKAAALSMTQSLRAYLAPKGVTVHGVFVGPTDTDMNRGFDIPKSPVEAVARGILDGVENGEEDVFPDPMSHSIAEAWRGGISKTLERQNAGFLQESYR